MEVYDPYIDPEIKAAAYDQESAVIVYQGDAILAPMEHIDPDKVELACNMDGCALIPDDGDPTNDIIVSPSY